MKFRSRATFLVSAVLLIVPACTVSVERSEPSTPQITQGADDPSLENSLLSLAEVLGARGAPDGLVERPVEDAALFENPDPRGPCGAEVSQPDNQEAAIVAFVTPEPPRFSSFHAVWELPTGEAKGYVDAYRADARPGCPTFESTIPDGTKQKVELLEIVEIPDLGDSAVAIVARITVPETSAYAVSSMVYRGDRLSVFSGFSEDPISAKFLREVTVTGAEKL